MLSLKINYDSQDLSKGNNGKLKDVAGVIGSPISIMPGFHDLEDQFNQMGITDIRMHDLFGVGDIDNGFPAGRLGNGDQMIPNVPPQQADRARELIAKIGNLRTIYPNAAIGMSRRDYDLAFKDANFDITDDYIRRIMNNNPAVNPQDIQREIMFRIGRTNGGSYELPVDFSIYAALVASLVDRYSLNIAQSGIPRKIAYWEIWNEPDLTFFWNSNDPSRYYEFYAQIARMIKAVDPHAKVGGAGVANGYNPGGAYLDGLLSFCSSKNVPLDFLSWHYYGNLTSDPQNFIDVANSVQSSLRRYGFDNAESICTEWNSSPFATSNVFTKVQSARNAAYIASSLIHMQSCKVDKAYYYRRDALSFGLFNDHPNPQDTRYKSFCSYAAQAFGLFNQLKQTPTLLSVTDTSNTGISVLAGKAGNKLNVLVANYRVDPSLSRANTPPADSTLYQQNYVDSGRDIAEITDAWSTQHYFAGKNPATLYNNNVVTQNPTARQLPILGTLRARSRNYFESSGGVSINIANLPFPVKTVEARRIVEGGNLGTILAPVTASQVPFKSNGATCTISDSDAKEFTVTLYTLTLDNKDDAPRPSRPKPQPPIWPDVDRGFSALRMYYGQNVIDISGMLLTMNIPNNFFVRRGELFEVRLAVAPSSNFVPNMGPNRSNNPYLSGWNGNTFGGSFYLIRGSLPNARTPWASFLIQSANSGNLADILKAAWPKSWLWIGNSAQSGYEINLRWSPST